MSTQAHNAVVDDADAVHTDTGSPDPSTSDAAQYLAFEVHGREMALPLDMIAEIIRPPAITPVPLSPECLPGVFSLRGSVLPVICLRRVAGDRDDIDDDAKRILVLNRRPRLGLRVDRVHRVFNAAVPDSRERSDEDDSSISGGSGELMTRGALQDQSRIIQLLDVDAVLDRQLGEWQEAEDAGDTANIAENGDNSSRSGQEKNRAAEKIAVSLRVAGQDFGLDALSVREILDCPEEISPVPRAPEGMLGLAALRGATVPLFSLRRLLDFPDEPSGKRVVILPVGNGGLCVGLVVDDVNEVLRIPEDEIGPVPQLGDTTGREFAGVYRLPVRQPTDSTDGKGLLTLIDGDAFLQVHQLAAMAERMIQQKSGGVDGQGGLQSRKREAGAMQQYVIFELDGQSFGAPISIVREILRLPEDLTGVPDTSGQVEGVINLRGRVLPVVDMRRRFSLPASEWDESQRVLVLDLGSQRAGFIVDSVSEVLKVNEDRISDAGELTISRAEWVAGVIRREDDTGMVLILDEERVMEANALEALKAVS